MRARLVTLAALACLSLTGCGEGKETAQNYDLVIANGRVMDPETNYDHVANIGITDGVIKTVSTAELDGKEKIDATGLVVAPGFIDTHWHGLDPLSVKIGLRDGITTRMDLDMVDSNTVTDHATFKAGKQGLPRTSIPYVIVNGQVVVRDSEVSQVYAGQPVRYPVEGKGRFMPVTEQEWLKQFPPAVK